MKKIFFTLAVLGSIPLLHHHGISYAEETKRVCVDKKDSKGNVVKKADGTVVQDCKEMKVHKKLEGTKVPEKTDKK